jgi:hypothetical protein
MMNAFIGDNARFAGPWVVANYLSTSGSSNGSLSFSEGYNLLETTVIIPKTFEPNEGGTSTARWHTTHAALPYTMVEKALHFGLWLNEENYVIYYPENNKTYLEAYGTSPVMMLIQPDNMTDVASQTYNGQPGETARMIAGLKKMYLSFLGNGKQVQMGNEVISVSPLHEIDNRLEIWPNPAREYIKISGPNRTFDISVYSMDGRKKYHKKGLSGETTLNISEWKNGMYILICEYNSSSVKEIKKLVIY